MERGFHCFKCDAKGDVIRFVELYRDVDFKNAIDLINNEFKLWDNSRFKYSNRPIQARKRERQLSDYKELFKALGERHTAELNKLLEKNVLKGVKENRCRNIFKFRNTGQKNNL